MLHALQMVKSLEQIIKMLGAAIARLYHIRKARKLVSWMGSNHNKHK